MTSAFDFDAAGARQIEQDMADRGAGKDAITGGLVAAGDVLQPIWGVMRSASKAASLGMDAAAPSIKTSVRPLDKVAGTDLEGFVERERLRTRRAVEYFAPDPHTTGKAGQLLNGLFDIGSAAVVGGILGGAPGAAAAAGANAAQGSLIESEKQGVKGKAAVGRALIEGGMTAAGVAAPAAIGGKVLLNALLYGPAANVVQGTVQRKMLADWLSSQGHVDIARQYQTFDGEAMLTDAVLGAVFGALGAKANIPPSAVDAALVLERARQGRDAAPGVPADLATMQKHTAALDAAVQALATGDRAPLEAAIRDLGEFVKRRPENMTAAERAIAEHLPKRVLTGHQATIAAAAEAQGVNPELALAISSIETGGKFNADAKNPRSSAVGLFQFLDPTWRQMGGTDANRMDPQAQADLGAKFIAQNARGLTQALGREPAPHEVYLAHLLGLGGATRVLRADGDMPLIDVIRGYDQKNAEAIVRDNGMAGMTVRQAVEKWRGKIAERMGQPVAKPVEVARAPKPEPTDQPAPEPAPSPMETVAKAADQAMPDTGIGDILRQAFPAREAQQADPLAGIPEVAAAQQALDARPDLFIATEGGDMPARVALDMARQDATATQSLAKGFDAAVNCFLRNAA